MGLHGFTRNNTGGRMIIKPFRVGVVGANPSTSWASVSHIPAIKALPQFSLSALATTNSESAKAAGEAF